MGQLGLGVMINALSGNAESVNAFKSAVGKTIDSVELDADDALRFTFSDGSRLKLWDDGQSCCESRYMRTDDDLSRFVGARLLDAEIKEAPTIVDENGEDHEVQFLEIRTSAGSFTMASHNEHNGYYGGFYIRAEAD